jgi:hypothetical protein
MRTKPYRLCIPTARFGSAPSGQAVCGSGNRLESQALDHKLLSGGDLSHRWRAQGDAFRNDGNPGPIGVRGRRGRDILAPSPVAEVSRMRRATPFCHHHWIRQAIASSSCLKFKVSVP